MQLGHPASELKKLRASDVAAILAELGRGQQAQVTALATPSAAVEALRQLKPSQQAALLAELSESDRNRCRRCWTAANLRDQAASGTNPATHPSSLSGPLLAALSIFGPGLIAANAGNDAGGILTYASAGSQFGYRTLFLMVLVTVALVVVQEMCSRLGVYTGEGLGGLLREQFSARSTFGAWPCCSIANAGLTVSEFAGVGAAFEIFGVSPYVSVPIAAVAVWALTVFGYLLEAPNGCSSSCRSPSWPTRSPPSWVTPTASRCSATWCGRISWHTHAFLVLAVALIGTTITPYMQFYVASAVVDKGVKPADYPKRADRHGQRRHLERRHQHLHHHRHRRRHRRHRAAAVRPAGRQGAEAGRRPGRPAAVRFRTARGVTARRLGGAALDLLRHRRRDGCAPFHHRTASARPRSSTVSSPCRSWSEPASPRTRQPGGARRQRPGAQRDHHPDAARPTC